MLKFSFIALTTVGVIVLVPLIDSSLIPTTLKTLSATKFAVTSLAYLTLSFPFGNVGSALQAIVKDPEAITCSLDTMLTDENHSSCQQLDRVVRVRAGKLLTIKQVHNVSYVSSGIATLSYLVMNGTNSANYRYDCLLF